MKTVIVVAAPFFLLAACGEETSQPEVAIVAHRGALHDYPENTITAFQKAVDLGADIVEIDLRTSSDGHLFILHDAALNRTTSGTGEAGDYTLEELQQLDAGSWFAPDFADEQIPSFPQVLKWASEAGITLLLDLKESGHAYAVHIVDDIQKYGVEENIVVGVRSAEQARDFRELLPESKQLAFMGSPDEIEAFADAGADVIRLWFRWLDEDPALAQRVRQAGKKLMINGTDGRLEEARAILEFEPDWILIDDVVQLQRSLEEISPGAEVQKPDKDDEFLHTIQVRSAQEMQDFFRYTGNDILIVSGHRGGIVEGFPENSIEAFEHTLKHTHAIFEIDPRTNSDNLNLAEKLNDLGVMVMIGTAPSYDHLDSSEERSEAYRRLLEEGVNIIESDLPIEVGRSVQSYLPQDSPKRKYFGKYTPD